MSSTLPPVEAIPLTVEKAAVAAKSAWTLMFLSLLMAFASISTDIYLPAMPTMADALRASAGSVEFTVSGYLVGFTVGQLFWGPLSDRWGRRLPIAIGLLLFVAGSAGCATAQNIHALIGWRAVQAIGACAGVTLGRAMVRDLYVGTRAAQIMSTLMIVGAIAPLVGPSLGGFILHVAQWRVIFWILVAVGIVTLGCLHLMPETLPEARRVHQPLSRVFSAYGMLLGQPRLLGYAGATGFLYGAIFAYVAGTPCAYIVYHHVPPQYFGLLFSLGSIGIMLTNLVNVRLVARFGSDRLLRSGAVTIGVAGVAAMICAWTGWGGLVGLVVPLFVCMSCTGLISANAITGALALFPGHAGSVSALVGAAQFGTGIVGSAAVGFFANGTPLPMAAAMAFFGIGTMLCAWLLVPKIGAATCTTCVAA